MRATQSLSVTDHWWPLSNPLAPKISCLAGVGGICQSTNGSFGKKSQDLRLLGSLWEIRMALIRGKGSLGQWSHLTHLGELCRDRKCLLIRIRIAATEGLPARRPVCWARCVHCLHQHSQRGPSSPYCRPSSSWSSGLLPVWSLPLFSLLPLSYQFSF